MIILLMLASIYVAETQISLMSFMSGYQKHNSFCLKNITASEISIEIKRLNTSKSCGPFSVPIKILKKISEHISVPLETIFNCSISTCTVPDNFEIARSS